MTLPTADELKAIEHRDSYYRKSPGVGDYAPDDRRKLLALVRHLQERERSAREFIATLRGECTEDYQNCYQGPDCLCRDLEAWLAAPSPVGDK
jgi:hypothetical protein